MTTRTHLALGIGAVLVLGSLCVAAALPSRKPSAREHWTLAEIDVLASLRLSRSSIAATDPSNAFHGSPAAAALGKRLFHDARLSRNRAVSCASCHAPEKQFQDGLPVGRGIGVGTRRSMPVVAAGTSPWLFWDGRKDSLWSQALGPLEDAVEHGTNRTRVAHLIAAHYRIEYEDVFGPLPDISSLPADGGPFGDASEVAAWEHMSDDERDRVSRIFANVGKAIAAFEATLVYGESRFDRYAAAVIANEPSADGLLTQEEVGGLRVFIGKGQCVTCHNGPLLSDQSFHNTGVPPRDPARPDRGRAAAIERLLDDEFNCLGPYSDADPEQCLELRFLATDDPALEGAFRTPSLRNVAERPPYMHAGQFATLGEAIGHYARSPKAAIGHSELVHAEQARDGRTPIRLSSWDIANLEAFLGTLTGTIVERAPETISSPSAPMRAQGAARAIETTDPL